MMFSTNPWITKDFAEQRTADLWTQARDTGSQPAARLRLHPRLQPYAWLRAAVVAGLRLAHRRPATPACDSRSLHA